MRFCDDGAAKRLELSFADCAQQCCVGSFALWVQSLFMTLPSAAVAAFATLLQWIRHQHVFISRAGVVVPSEDCRRSQIARDAEGQAKSLCRWPSGC